MKLHHERRELSCLYRQIYSAILQRNTENEIIFGRAFCSFFTPATSDHVFAAVPVCPVSCLYHNCVLAKVQQRPGLLSATAVTLEPFSRKY